jgi:excisionase family DNA binding protein
LKKWRSLNQNCQDENTEDQELKERLNMSEFFTVYELARYFNVNPKTVYRRLWAKAIPAYRVGRRWRIGKKDIISLKR